MSLLRCSAWLVLIAACSSGSNGGESTSCFSCPGWTPPVQTSPDAAYPSGPYGTTSGTTIADFMVTGMHNTSLMGSLISQPVTNIWLSSYRNDYKAIVVMLSAAWCPHCIDAAPAYQSLYLSENSSGPKIAFLEVMVQGTDHQPAVASSLDSWVSMFGLTYDVAVDPVGALLPYYYVGGQFNSFPGHLVIRTSDMQIVYVQSDGDITNVQAAVAGILAM
jgi:hypothetical protein